MMKEIPLIGGTAARVDDDDYARLSCYSWRLYQRPNSSYAVAYLDGHGFDRRVWMHRLVMEAKAGEIVDHIDADGLNNQRCKLRVCSNAENQRNRRKPKTRAAISSRFKGVTWHGGKWRAKIVVDGKQRHLGRFEDEVEAAKAYDGAARKHFGRYAWTNFKLEKSGDKSVANRTNNEES